jgi:COP9 signalosome complex subunit 2
MLDFIEKAAEDADAYRCMEKFYALTLDIFQSTNNERLWLKTNIKLARLWLERKDYRQLTEKLRELHKACQREDGTDDPSKGTYSLEVYSLEILMYAETRNNKRLKVSLVPTRLDVRPSNPLSGSLPASSQGKISSSTSQNHGYHPRMRWQDAHE